MYIIVWEYKVKPECATEFEIAYGGGGEWVRLFTGAQGYLGTHLLCDAANPMRYLTLDLWSSETDYKTFRDSKQEEYTRIDQHCDQLIEKETSLGVFTKLE